MEDVIFEINEKCKTKPINILIVDDDPLICKMLEALLSRTNHAVKTTTRVFEALESVEKNMPDLVLTDLFVGSNGGFEILHRVKASDPGVPVIIMTGNPDQQYIIDAFRNNADDILIKPVGREELIFRVDKALEKLDLRRQEARMKQLLEVREKLFRTFMDYLPLQIFVNDAEDRLIYANKKHDEYYNSRKNMLHKLEDIFPQDIVEILYANNKKARETGLIDHFQTMTTRDGRVKKFRTLLFPLELGDNSDYLGGIGIDMTEQLLVEKALKDSEERLGVFIRTIPHGLMENDTTGRITLCNPGYCRLLGLEAEEVLGRNVIDFQPTVEEKERRSSLIDELNRGFSSPGSFTGRIRRSDGVIIDVQVDWEYRRGENGTVIGYIAAVTDITRLKEAEETVRRSEALLKSIMDSPRNINIWSIDRDLRYTFFNYNHKKDMKAFWNVDIQLGKPVTEYISDTGYIDVIKEFYQKVFSNEHTRSVDSLASASGETHVFENFGNPITDEQDNVTGATIFTIDITSRMRGEERLRQSLAEKEILLKEIHHRVKNNLQIISSILNMQMDGIEDETARAIFNESQNRIRSMSLIHEQLYRTENLGAIDMRTYTEALLSAIMGSMALNTQTLSVESSIDQIELDIDRAIPVGLILNELISNSIKHAYKPGIQGTLRIRFEAKDDRCILTMRDFGPGMPDNPEEKGAGSLGLQLVEALAAQLRGTFSSRNDNGLVCVVDFPKSPQV